MKRKTTEEFVNQAMNKHGNFYDYSLVDYKDSKTSVTIICPKHGEFNQVPNTHLVSGCNKCGTERATLKMKLKIEDVFELFRENGLEPLFKEYNKNSERLLGRTKEGYIVLICVNVLKTSKKLSVFDSKNRYTLQNIKLWLKINKIEYELIDGQTYVGSHKQLSFNCHKHGEFKTSWDNLHSGSGCQKCAKESMKNILKLNLEDIEEELNKLNIEILTKKEKYINARNHLEFKCTVSSCGNIWKTNLDSVRRGSGCPKCSLKRRSGEGNHKYNPNLTEEDRIKRRRLSTIENQRIWRIGVFKRDNYTCCICSQYGGKLNGHHLNGYNWDKEGRFDIDNGATLCKQCHKDFHKIYKMGNNTKEQFEDFKKTQIS